MRKKCFLWVILFFVFCTSVLAYDVVVTAEESCRAQGGTRADDNRHDGVKLAIRSDSWDEVFKSWIKFDVSGIDPNEFRSATLTLTMSYLSGGSLEGENYFNVSSINDSCVDNITWTQSNLTWNNAPANDTASLTDPDTTKATWVAQADFDGALVGDTYTFDVLAAMQEDTDGIVQFILHNSSTYMCLGVHDHETAAYRPTITISYPPAGADYPNPVNNATVDLSLGVLDWENPEPNIPGTPIHCDVYLGKDPNRLQMDKVTLDDDISVVDINLTNFEHFGSLDNFTKYYWVVDCYDTEKGLIPGEMWSFAVNENQSPVVNAGPDQITWGLPKDIDLNGTVTDDGLPEAYTVLWTQSDNGAPTVAVSPDDEEAASVTITEPGDYAFILTANDGQVEVFDTVHIIVGTDACDASHIESGLDYNPADENEDCIVNLTDLENLILNDWLNCTDELTNCAQ